MVNATAQGSEEFQVISAVDSDFLRDVSTAYANHDRHSLARAIAIARCGLGEEMQGKLRKDTGQLWAERAHGPAHREERAAAHAADAARGGTGTDGAEAGGQAHIEERVVGDICAAEVGTQSSLNEQLNKSQLVALCGSEPEADADAGEEGCTTPRSPPSGAKRGRARWGDEAEGMGGAGPSGLAASDASDPLAAALLDNKPVPSGGESGTPDEALSPQGGLEETMAMSTEQAEATFVQGVRPAAR